MSREDRARLYYKKAYPENYQTMWAQHGLGELQDTETSSFNAWEEQAPEKPVNKAEEILNSISALYQSGQINTSNPKPDKYKYSKFISDPRDLYDGIRSGSLAVEGSDIFRVLNWKDTTDQKGQPYKKYIREGVPIGFVDVDGNIKRHNYKQLGEARAFGINFGKVPATAYPVNDQVFTNYARKLTNEDLDREEGAGGGAVYGATKSILDPLSRPIGALLYGNESFYAGRPIEEAYKGSPEGGFESGKQYGTMANKLAGTYLAGTVGGGIGLGAGLAGTALGAFTGVAGGAASVPEYISDYQQGEDTGAGALLRSLGDISTGGAGGAIATRLAAKMLPGIMQSATPGRDFLGYVGKSALQQAPFAVAGTGAHLYAESMKPGAQIDLGTAAKELGSQTAMQMGINMALDLVKGGRATLGAMKNRRQFSKQFGMTPQEAIAGVKEGVSAAPETATQTFNYVSKNDHLPNKDLVDRLVGDKVITPEQVPQAEKFIDQVKAMNTAARRGMIQSPADIPSALNKHIAADLSTGEPRAIVTDKSPSQELPTVANEGRTVREAIITPEGRAEGREMVTTETAMDINTKLRQIGSYARKYKDDPAKVFSKAFGRDDIIFQEHPSHAIKYLEKQFGREGFVNGKKTTVYDTSSPELVSAYREVTGLTGDTFDTGAVVSTAMRLANGEVLPGYLDLTNPVFKYAENAVNPEIVARYGQGSAKMKEIELLARNERGVMYDKLYNTVKDDPNLGAGDPMRTQKILSEAFGLGDKAAEYKQKFLNKTEGQTYDSIMGNFAKYLDDNGRSTAANVIREDANLPKPEVAGEGEAPKVPSILAQEEVQAKTPSSVRDVVTKQRERGAYRETQPYEPPAAVYRRMEREGVINPPDEFPFVDLTKVSDRAILEAILPKINDRIAKAKAEMPQSVLGAFYNDRFLNQQGYTRTDMYTMRRPDGKEARLIGIDDTHGALILDLDGKITAIHPKDVAMRDIQEAALVMAEEGMPRTNMVNKYLKKEITPEGDVELTQKSRQQLFEEEIYDVDAEAAAMEDIQSAEFDPDVPTYEFRSVNKNTGEVYIGDILGGRDKKKMSEVELSPQNLRAIVADAKGTPYEREVLANAMKQKNYQNTNLQITYKDVGKMGLSALVAWSLPDDEEYDYLKAGVLLGGMPKGKSLAIRSAFLKTRLGKLMVNIKGNDWRKSLQGDIHNSVYVNEPGILPAEKQRRINETNDIADRRANAVAGPKMIQNPTNRAFRSHDEHGPFAEHDYGAIRKRYDEGLSYFTNEYLNPLNETFNKSLLSLSDQEKAIFGKARSDLHYEAVKADWDTTMPEFDKDAYISSLHTRDNVVDRLVWASRQKSTGGKEISREQASALYDKIWNQWDEYNLMNTRAQNDKGLKAMGIDYKNIDAELDDALRQRARLRNLQAEYTGRMNAIKKLPAASPEQKAEFNELKKLRRAVYAGDMAEINRKVKAIENVKRTESMTNPLFYMDKWVATKIGRDYGLNVTEVHPTEQISKSGAIVKDERVHFADSRFKHHEWFKTVADRDAAWSKMMEDYNAKPWVEDGVETPGYYEIDATNYRGERIDESGRPVSETGNPAARIKVRLNRGIDASVSRGYLSQGGTQRTINTILRALQQKSISPTTTNSIDLKAVKNSLELLQKYSGADLDEGSSFTAALDAEHGQLNNLMRTLQETQNVLEKKGAQSEVAYQIERLLHNMHNSTPPAYRRNRGFTGWEPKSPKDWADYFDTTHKTTVEGARQGMGKMYALNEIDNQVLDMTLRGLQKHPYMNALIGDREFLFRQPGTGFWKDGHLKIGDLNINAGSAMNTAASFMGLKVLMLNFASGARNIIAGESQAIAMAFSSGIGGKYLKGIPKSKLKALQGLVQSRAGRSSDAITAWKGIYGDVYHQMMKDGLVEEGFYKDLELGGAKSSKLDRFLRKKYNLSQRDALYFVQAASEHLIRSSVAMNYADARMQMYPYSKAMADGLSHDQYVKLIADRARSFSNVSQGVYDSFSRTDWERKFLANPWTRNLLALQSPSLNTMYNWAGVLTGSMLKNNPNYMRNRIIGSIALLTAGAIFNGLEKTPVGLLEKAAGAVEFLGNLTSDEPSDEFDSKLVTENEAEGFWNGIANTLGNLMGDQKKGTEAANWWREVNEYGVVSALTGQKLGVDESPASLTPFPYTYIQQVYKKIKGSENKAEALGMAMLPTFLTRAIDAQKQYAEGERSFRGYSTGEKFGMKDYIVEGLFGKPLRYQIESERKFTDMIPLVSERDKADFARSALNIPGIELKFPGARTETITSAKKNLFSPDIKKRLTENAPEYRRDLLEKFEKSKTAVKKSQEMFNKWVEDHPKQFAALVSGTVTPETGKASAAEQSEAKKRMLRQISAYYAGKAMETSNMARDLYKNAGITISYRREKPAYFGSPDPRSPKMGADINGAPYDMQGYYYVLSTLKIPNENLSADDARMLNMLKGQLK